MGNSVATLVVAKWEGVFDLKRARRVLNREEDVDEFGIFDEVESPPDEAPESPPGRELALSGTVQV